MRAAHLGFAFPFVVFVAFSIVLLAVTFLVLFTVSFIFVFAVSFIVLYPVQTKTSISLRPGLWAQGPVSPVSHLSRPYEGGFVKGLLPMP